LPRFAQVLDEQGHLALVEESHLPTNWDEESRQALARYSMNRDFQRYDMMTVAAELEKRALFEYVDRAETKPVVVRQPVDEWVESVHARNGFSRDRMDKADAADCDAQLKEILTRHYPDGIVEKL